MALVARIVCILVGHKWDFKYLIANSCTKVEYCARCNHTDFQSTIVHEPNKWEYSTQDTCQQVTTCKHCLMDLERVFHKGIVNCVCCFCHQEVHDFVLKTCQGCDGKGEYETVGGYGNNPKYSSSPCTGCNGNGRHYQCKNCGKTIP